MLDGHNALVTPDPVPNSEVKLGMFVFVLSLMGTHGAVYLKIKDFYGVSVFGVSDDLFDLFHKKLRRLRRRISHGCLILKI